MYTDGLIERRGHNIDAGIELLANVFAQSEHISIDSTLRVVVGALGPPADDVALLVARLTHEAERFEVEMPARPEELAPLRRRLSAWLTAKGRARERRCARSSSPSARRATTPSSMPTPNALATSGSAVAEDDGVLRITVEDRGNWRPDERSDDTRGRGHLDHAHAHGRRDDRDDGARDAGRLSSATSGAPWPELAEPTPASADARQRPRGRRPVR